MGPPLSTAAVVNAIIFSSFGESSRLWDDYFYSNDNHPHTQASAPLHEHSTNPENQNGNPNSTNNNTTSDYQHSSWQKSFACGSFAGCVQSIVICPSEHVKCRLQIQGLHHSHGHEMFKGPFDAVDKILNAHGVRGLYRGFVCTAWREVPAFGLYFATYDYIKNTVTHMLSTRLKQQQQQQQHVTIMDTTSANTNNSNTNASSGIQPHTWAASCIAGGVSGAFTWAVIYPFDVIKTKIQTTPLETPLEQRRISFIYRKILREHGWRHLFRGLGVTVLRAFPVNAIIFPVYEWTLLQLVVEAKANANNRDGDGGADALTNA